MTIQTRSRYTTDYNWLLTLHRESYFDIITRQFGCWDEDEQLELFLDVWQSQNLVIIIKAGESVEMYVLDKYEDHLWLAELQITKLYRNKGIGTKVLEMLLMKAHAEGLPLRLRVLHKNHRAKKLYLQQGFDCISKSEHHYVMEAH